MVECEYICSSGSMSSLEVLIDTWWNVNVLYKKPRIYDDGVLIDTWWNVNRKKFSAIWKNSIVLIDTWWNVNR